MKKSVRAAVLSLTCMAALLSVSCGTPPPAEKVKMSEIYFDTVVDVELWGTSDGALLEGCKEICRKYEQMLSRTIDTSEVSKINSAGGRPVAVSGETAALINTGLYYSEKSGGLFDITIAPLSVLWDIRHNPGVIPDASDIEEAKSHVNYKNVAVDGNTVTLKDPKAGIDLGAIAKGYVADKLKEYLTANGIKHAIINLGGNVLTVGKKPDGREFNIGIQKPFAPRNETITSVRADGKSIVSSGIYERYFEKDGKYYHHILNPKTGFPFENNLLQVTIISNSSLEGDALSTTCFALGLEEGTALVDSLENIQAVFVTDDYALHGAGGFKTP